MKLYSSTTSYGCVCRLKACYFTKIEFCQAFPKFRRNFVLQGKFWTTILSHPLNFRLEFGNANSMSTTNFSGSHFFDKLIKVYSSTIYSPNLIYFFWYSRLRMGMNKSKRPKHKTVARMLLYLKHPNLLII